MGDSTIVGRSFDASLSTEMVGCGGDGGGFATCWDEGIEGDTVDEGGKGLKSAAGNLDEEAWQMELSIPD